MNASGFVTEHHSTHPRAYHCWAVVLSIISKILITFRPNSPRLVHRDFLAHSHQCHRDVGATVGLDSAAAGPAGEDQV